MDEVTKEMDKFKFNWLEGNANAKTGIVTSGIAYSYTKESIKLLGLEDKVQVLKLGLSYPLPYKLIEKLLSTSEQVLVAEEVEPIVEHQVRSFAQELGITIPIHGKKYLPRAGEYSIESMVEGLSRFLKINNPLQQKKIEKTSQSVMVLIPPRPPILCAGCMHRGVFFAMKKVEKKLKKDKKKKIKQIVMPSDIGCYTLGYQPPLNAVDSHLCMGASIGMANGFAHTIPDPVICTIGDSTFFHAGIPPLLNSVFNTSNLTVMILDNSTTAMTGYQPHPGTGVQACGETTKCIQIEDIVSACGIEFLEIVNPYNITELVDIIEKSVLFPGPAVIIARRLCRMLELRDKVKVGEKFPTAMIDPELCKNCKACLTQFGCPAFYLENDQIEINSDLCNGCGMCIDNYVCKYGAIRIDE
jgi:indolepyruvate ferredoxin oxidoreductase alpha subunit